MATKKTKNSIEPVVTVGSHSVRTQYPNGRVDFVVDGRHREVDREQIAGGIDRRLDPLLGNVDIHAQGELKGDHRRSARAAGGHLIEPRHLTELALQGGGNRRCDHVRACTRIQRYDLNGRIVHLRKG